MSETLSVNRVRLSPDLYEPVAKSGFKGSYPDLKLSSEKAPGTFVRKSREILNASLQVLKDTLPPVVLVAMGAAVVAAAGAVSPIVAPTLFLLGGLLTGVGGGLAYLNSEKYFYR